MSDRAHLKTILVAMTGDREDRAREIAGILSEELSPVEAGVKIVEEKKGGGETHFPLARDTGTLYLTDLPGVHERLRLAGLPCACFTDDLKTNGSFPGAPYLLTEPEWVDADSYEKIYERLCGLPWTILETKRLLIRELSLEDTGALLALYNDPAARRFLEAPEQDPAKEIKRLDRYIRRVYGLCGYGYWALVEKATGALIGLAGFRLKTSKEGRAELGYLVREDKRGQGFAFEACSHIIGFALQNLPFTGIEAQADPKNTASICLLVKLGLKKSGDKYVLDAIPPGMV